MPDFNNGKIYVIRNRKNLLVYVGSTIQPLAQRMAGHRHHSKTERCKSAKIYRAFHEYGVDEFYIELVEMFPCELKIELAKREGYYIRQFDSYNNGYNGKIEGRTTKEYYINNKEKVKEYYEVNKESKKERRIEYREINKESIKERDKEYRKINKDALAEKSKEWREANKEVIAEKAKKRRESNKEVIARKKKAYYEAKKHLKSIEISTPTLINPLL